MKRTEPMNVVVSGMGRISWSYHMPTLSKDPRFRMIAAVDPLPERRAEAEATYPGLRTYADYNEMLRSESSAELVVITNYVTITNADLRNTFSGLILPSVTSVFYIYLLKENFLLLFNFGLCR